MNEFLLNNIYEGYEAKVNWTFFIQIILKITEFYLRLTVYSHIRKRAKAIKKKDDEKRLKFEAKIVDEYYGKLHFIYY